MRRAGHVVFATILAVLPACGDAEPIPDADLLLRVTAGAEEVAPGQGFPVTVVRVWRKDVVPSAWNDRALSPLTVKLVETTRREDEERVEEVRRYRGYAFTLKDVTMPAVPFSVQAAGGGAPRVTRSEPVAVRVRPVLDPKDPGPPEGPGAPPGEDATWLLRLLAILVALLAAVVVGVLEARRRPPGGPAADALRGSSPAARALAELEAIRARTSENAEALGADVMALSDVVRDYVAAQFGVQARRRTTPEVLAALAEPGAGLAAVLGPCDLVKFAGRVPDPAERAALLDRAVTFVRAAGGA